MLRRLPLIAVAALAALLTGCAGSTPASPPTPSPDDDGHGAIAGASEVSEPPLGLTTIDPDGNVRHLDLLDESVAELGEVPPPTAVAGDGRYLFATGDDGVTIVDSGRWTWDHVDHFHYYRAEPKLLGLVPGRGAASVSTTNSSTTGGTGLFFAETGEAVLLDTEALSKGEIVERFRLTVEPHAGLVVPVGSFALVTEPRSGFAASVALPDGDGEVVPGASAECADARGTITTRV
ncbi:MAG: ABC transporter, partial [Microbacterium sp.]